MTLKRTKCVPNGVKKAIFPKNYKIRLVAGGFGSGGFRGGCIPPTSLKVTILAEKSASVSNNSAPFRDASPPTDLNVTNPAKNQSQFW